MEFSKNELDIETLCAEVSAIRLESSATLCQVCKTGSVVPVGREASLVIYTRTGTKRGVHIEKRCNNRSLPCRAGHYYGYLKTAEGKIIERNALRKEYLITSSQTAFAVDYLWDTTLQILFNRATFEGLSNVYNNFHFTNIPFDTRQKREAVVCKRIAEGFYMYAYIEIGQRYDIAMTIPRSLEEAILEQKSALHDSFRRYWSTQHTCDVRGCGEVLTIDGGCKPHRKLCGSKLSGVREFKSTGLKIVTGCTSIPAPTSKFCNTHVASPSPALLSEQVSKSTRNSLRDHRTANSNTTEAPQDSIYVIETILATKIDDGIKMFNVKWLGFPPDASTWEPENSIPKFIQLYYQEKTNFGKSLPNPRLKNVKKAGSSLYHYLTWDGESDVGTWVHEDFFKLLGEDGEIVTALEEDKSCNTRKSRDKVRVLKLKHLILNVRIFSYSFLCFVFSGHVPTTLFLC